MSTNSDDLNAKREKLARVCEEIINRIEEYGNEIHLLSIGDHVHMAKKLAEGLGWDKPPIDFPIYRLDDPACPAMAKIDAHGKNYEEVFYMTLNDFMGVKKVFLLGAL